MAVGESLTLIEGSIKVDKSMNPWTAALRDGRNMYEIEILLWTVFFVSLNTIFHRVAKKTGESKKLDMAFSKAKVTNDIATGWGLPLTKQSHNVKPGLPTAAYCASTLHAVVLTVGALVVLVLGRYDVFPQYLAFSIGYYISDALVWAIPARDYLWLVHRVLLTVVSYPVGSLSGATLMGAGDPYLITRVVAACYLTELAGICLSLRWFVLHFWPNAKAYRFTSIAVLASWVPTRFVVIPAFLLYIISRFQAYYEYNQIMAFSLGALTILSALALSLLSTFRMLKHGVGRFINLHHQKPLEVEHATSTSPATTSLRLRVFFAALILVPQAIMICTQSSPSVHELYSTWFESFVHWKEWLTSPSWWSVLIGMTLQSATYCVVWTNSKWFARQCKTNPLLRVLGSKPVDVVLVFFYIFKVLQIGSPLIWYVLVAPPPKPSEVTIYQLVTAVQLFCIGQWFNASIYFAIGKNGVYYGSRLGESVPWVNGYPFNVISHPQYSGVVASILGMVILMATKAHADAGWFGFLVAQTIIYVFTGYVESHF